MNSAESKHGCFIFVVFRSGANRFWFKELRNRPDFFNLWVPLVSIYAMKIPPKCHQNANPMPPLCHPYATPMPSLCHPYATPLCHPYATPMPPYATLCHPMPPYATPLCHPYATPMPPYATLCHPMPPYATLCHPYAIPMPSLCHPYATFARYLFSMIYLSSLSGIKFKFRIVDCSGINRFSFSRIVAVTTASVLPGL